MNPYDARDRMIRRMLHLTDSKGYGNIRMDFDGEWKEEAVNEDSYPNHKGRPGRRGGSIPRDGAYTDAEVKVNGPSQSQEFIETWAKQHPEEWEGVKAKAKKFRNILSRVSNFQAKHPHAKDGTYDAMTGKRVELSTGFSLTFHQNHSLDHPYADYDKKTYALLCAITCHELGTDDVYIGYFGNAEVSFHCDNYNTARRFAVEHNQDSVWDCEMNRVIKNPKRNKETNPVESDLKGEE